MVSLGEYVKLPDAPTRRACREIVIAVAKRHGCPPAHVTAHVTNQVVNAARAEAMLEMLKLGLKRCQVAWAFNRSLRRVRASVIGGPRSRHGHTGPDYSKVDLFGEPLPHVERRPHPSYRMRYEEAMAVLKMAALESELADLWVREMG